MKRNLVYSLIISTFILFSKKNLAQPSTIKPPSITEVKINQINICNDVIVSGIVRPDATKINIYYRIAGAAVDSVDSFAHPPEGTPVGSNAFVRFLRKIPPSSVLELRTKLFIGDLESGISEPFIFNVPNFSIPPVITGLRVDSVSSCRAHISWTPLSSGPSYNLEIKQISPVRDSTMSRIKIQRKSFTDYSFPVSDLQPDAVYEFKVRHSPISGGCYSEFSEPFRFTTKSPLSEFRSVKLDSATFSGKRADLIWDVIPQSAYYQITYKAIQPGNIKFENIIVTSNTVRLNLLPDVEYQWFLRAFRGSMVPCPKDPSVNGRFRMLSVINIPKNLRVIEVKHNNAKLTWDRSPYGGSYQIQYRTGSGPFTSTTVNDNLVELINLVPEKTYELKIQNVGMTAEGGVIHSATSEFSQPIQFTTISDPCIPASPKAIINSVSSVMHSTELKNTITGKSTIMTVPALNIQVTNLRTQCQRTVSIEYLKESPNPLQQGKMISAWIVWKACPEIKYSGTSLLVKNTNVAKPAFPRGYRLKIETPYGTILYMLPANLF